MSNPFLEDVLATLSAMTLSPAQLARLREWIDSLVESPDGVVYSKPIRRDQPDAGIDRH